MRRLLVPFLLVAALGGNCVLAQPATEPDDEEAAPKSGAKLPDVELSPQIIYQLLLAEIAGGRGNLALSVQAYGDLARTTRDPRIAQRAAQIALYARRFDAALDAAKLWLELDPKSIAARQMMTTLLAATRRPDELAEHLGQLLAAEKGDRGAALLQLNRALARVPDKREVLRIVDRVTTPYLDMAEARFARAVAAFGAKDSPRALAEVDKTLELRPDWELPVLLRAQLLPRPQAIEVLSDFAQKHKPSRDLRLMLARMYSGEKRYAEARDLFRGLLAESPDDADTIYAVGVLSYQLGEKAEAGRLLKRLVELKSPDASSARLYLGQIAEEEKHWSEAAGWYEGIRSGEQYVAARLRQANALSRQSGLDAGLRHLREARSGPGPGSDGDNAVRLLIGEAEMLREAGRGADALTLLEQGLADQPDQQDLLYEAGLVAERLGRHEIFDARLRRLLELKPDHAHAYNALGYSMIERNGNLDEAERLIDKAVSLAPDDAFILDSKGWLQFKRGNGPGALKTLQRAFAIRSDPEIAAHLGEVLWSLGRKDEAARTWREAAKAHPANEVLSATIQRFRP